MKKYIKYLSYVLRHKYYVAIECFKVGLYWRGIMHDMSKLRPSEFIPYAKYFYGNNGDITRGRDKSGSYRAGESDNYEFNFAWLLHQKRNPHHWQYWILSLDDGGLKIFDMDWKYELEMVCDWVGAGKAMGKFSPKDDKYMETRKWYEANKNHMQIGPWTRNKIESLIEYEYKPKMLDK